MGGGGGQKSLQKEIHVATIEKYMAVKPYFQLGLKIC